MSDEHAPRYWWFAGVTVRELVERLVAAGDAARLEVHPKGDALFLVVTRTDEDDDARDAKRLQPLNESHPCPPTCG